MYIRRPLLWRRQGGPGTTEGVEPELSKSLLEIWLLELPASGFWTLQTLQNFALARLWAQLPDGGLWALARQILFFLMARNSPSNPSNPPKLALKPPEPCQWVCHTGSWSSQLLDSERFRRSKTLGSVPDCGRSCADCGLWRAKPFFPSGPKLPFKPLKRLKPLKPPETCQWFCHTGSWSSQLLDSGRFRPSKTSHLLDCGLWALSQTVGAVAQTAGTGLWRAKFFFPSGPKLPFKPLKRLKPLKPPETCKWFCHTGSWSSQLLDSGRFRRSKTSHLTVGSGLCAQLRRLRALGSGAPNPFFLVARNCPSNPFNASNPSNPPKLANGSAILEVGAASFWILDASNAPKPRPRIC